MKQIFLLFNIFFSTVLLSQTILTSYPLSLTKNSEANTILTAENEVTHDVFAFIRSAENFKILRYNSALFLTDEMSVSNKYTEDRTLTGFSFSDDGNPTLYWSSQRGESIIIIKYYFEDKSSKALQFSFPSTLQTIRAEYQNNNSFNLLAQDVSEPKLILYVFKNGAAEQKIFDFSPFVFRDKKTQQETFSQILRDNQIEKMDMGEYNPLYKVSSKTKIYPLKDRIILTLDHNPRKTQLFDINLATLDIQEKNYTQPASEKAVKSSNSFYQDNTLFQVSANQNEFLFDIKNLTSGETVKSMRVSKKDTIRFKNSPLLYQKDNAKPKELKNTARFLQQLAVSNIGLSVFKNKKNLYITIGGINEYYNTWSYNSADEFGNFYPDIDGGNVHSESVFFESILNKKFETTTELQQPLAKDKIYYFIDNHEEVNFESILKFKNYYILSYYDSLAKQYVMRKFIDGYN
ncbi:hypothetical protein [Flavobacterium reichenbachii]|uniref:hypothetical protein n=1 Tax=Flavobacterium reichenbachii TaxID=362418 RepID=UPI00068D89F7|nr:hypothetical protein [Flavobacterium reichenbachii]OXB14187.1 hypothetical protein B0A68_13265 [Flavobacterium reichenbachii]